MSDISRSDIDILALLDILDQNFPLSILNFKQQQQASDSSQVSQGGRKRRSTDAVTQSDIDQITLSQLNALGERLSNTEKGTSEPTVTHKGFDGKVAPTSGFSGHDLPPPDKLTKEAILKCQIDMKKLTEQAKPDQDKIKSQRGEGSVEVFVQDRVKWPHEFVLSGRNHLSQIQWVAGFYYRIII